MFRYYRTCWQDIENIKKAITAINHKSKQKTQRRNIHICKNTFLSHKHFSGLEEGECVFHAGQNLIQPSEHDLIYREQSPKAITLLNCSDIQINLLRSEPI